MADLTLLSNCSNRSSSDDVHLRKLGATQAPSHHLWLWTDAATGEGFRQAFEATELRLPTRAPQLPEAVTDLWCVDEVHSRGWYWSPRTGWTWVSAAHPTPTGG
jgi:hypothetical protein